MGQEQGRLILREGSQAGTPRRVAFGVEPQLHHLVLASFPQVEKPIAGLAGKPWTPKLQTASMLDKPGCPRLGFLRMSFLSGRMVPAYWIHPSTHQKVFHCLRCARLWGSRQARILWDCGSQTLGLWLAVRKDLHHDPEHTQTHTHMYVFFVHRTYSGIFYSI